MNSPFERASRIWGVRAVRYTLQQACAAILLSSAALILGSSSAALAGNFAVGGGIVSTSDPNDTADDQTSAHGGFQLYPAMTVPTDSISISSVAIDNTAGTHSIFGAFFAGSNKNLTVTAQGNNLRAPQGVGLSLDAAGSVSLDTTAGASNIFDGSNVGIDVGAGEAANIRTGADTIKRGIVAFGSTVVIDSVGATISSTSFGPAIFAQGGVSNDPNDPGGSVTIGGMNGGIASKIVATQGYGIDATDIGG